MIKFLIISTSKHLNASDFIEETLNNMEYDEEYDEEYGEEYDEEYDRDDEKLDKIRTILENPQDVINAFNTFYHKRKYRILDALFEKGLSYDLGVMVLSMHDFKPLFHLEYLNTL